MQVQTRIPPGLLRYLQAGGGYLMGSVVGRRQRPSALDFSPFHDSKGRTVCREIEETKREYTGMKEVKLEEKQEIPEGGQ